MEPTNASLLLKVSKMTVVANGGHFPSRSIDLEGSGKLRFDGEELASERASVCFLKERQMVRGAVEDFDLGYVEYYKSTGEISVDVIYPVEELREDLERRVRGSLLRKSSISIGMKCRLDKGFPSDFEGSLREFTVIEVTACEGSR